MNILGLNAFHADSAACNSARSSPAARLPSKASAASEERTASGRETTENITTTVAASANSNAPL